LWPAWSPAERSSLRIAQPAGQAAGAFDAAWAFVVEPVDAGRSRLFQRFRFAARPRRWAGLAYTLLIVIPHFVMEFGMLRGIKQRAERSWSNPDAGQPAQTRPYHAPR
jgi:hypothetical protein